MPQGLCTCRYHLLACFSHVLARPPRLCQETLGPSVAVLERPVRPCLARVIPHNLLVPFLRVICLFRPPGCWPHEVLAAGVLFVAASRYLSWRLAGSRWAMSVCSVEDPGCAPWPGGSAFRYLNHLLPLVSWLNKINTLEVLRPVLGIPSVPRKQRLIRT